MASLDVTSLMNISPIQGSSAQPSSSSSSSGGAASSSPCRSPPTSPASPSCIRPRQYTSSSVARGRSRSPIRLRDSPTPSSSLRGTPNLGGMASPARERSPGRVRGSSRSRSRSRSSSPGRGRSSSRSPGRARGGSRSRSRSPSSIMLSSPPRSSMTSAPCGAASPDAYEIMAADVRKTSAADSADFARHSATVSCTLPTVPEKQKERVQLCNGLYRLAETLDDAAIGMFVAALPAFCARWEHRILHISHNPVPAGANHLLYLDAQQRLAHSISTLEHQQQQRGDSSKQEKEEHEGELGMLRCKLTKLVERTDSAWPSSNAAPLTSSSSSAAAAAGAAGASAASALLDAARPWVGCELADDLVNDLPFCSPGPCLAYFLAEYGYAMWQDMAATLLPVMPTRLQHRVLQSILRNTPRMPAYNFRLFCLPLLLAPFFGNFSTFSTLPEPSLYDHVGASVAPTGSVPYRQTVSRASFDPRAHLRDQQQQHALAQRSSISPTDLAFFSLDTAVDQPGLYDAHAAWARSDQGRVLLAVEAAFLHPLAPSIV